MNIYARVSSVAAASTAVYCHICLHETTHALLFLIVALLVSIDAKLTR